MAKKKQLPQNNVVGNAPNLSQAKSSSLTVTRFHGPIPPASELQKYESALPGSAERILAMAEKEQEHRHTLEKAEREIAVQAIRVESKAGQLGTISGLAVAIAGLVASVVLGIFGREVAAGIIGVADITALASLFVYERRVRKEILQVMSNRSKNKYCQVAT